MVEYYNMKTTTKLDHRRLQMSKEYVLDWNDYVQAARNVVAEGCVLLENRGHVLPLQKGAKVSVFGRIQTHYYKSGTGSGGMVNVSKVIGIVDALKESGQVEVNEDLLHTYMEWEESNPFDEGEGWGCEPWSQEEMRLSEELVSKARKDSDIAIVVIGRTAGEDKDATDMEGSYRLTKIEYDMLQKVRDHFDKMIVLLNVGGLIDMQFVDVYQPEAVMYVWQGGMIGGLGIADVLLGNVSPSGHLTDTVAHHVEDYPSHKNFGNPKRNYYEEDIYVGYRYFETFAPEAVRYPFGYGLSYTTFDMKVTDVSLIENEEKEGNFPETKDVVAKLSVTNTGNVPGKAVAQVYVEMPQGKLGKPARVMADFWKTEELQPGETVESVILFSLNTIASYDDSGITGHKSCFVLEEGCYHIYVGENVRDAKQTGSFELKELLVIEELKEALAPVEEFSRMKPRLAVEKLTTDKIKYTIHMEPVPLAAIDMDERRDENIPEEVICDLPEGEIHQLQEVKDGTITMEQFVAQMTDEELTCIVRGEGMGSPRVTPGTAAAFGGVSDSLVNRLGIPSMCCSDGPSGMRIDCGVKAFSLPNGTLMGSTFNPDLIEELYTYTGLEMVKNQIDCLLGPGMNIHRHPLNGRNFEYFSEDPLLTGVMGTAMVKGLRRYHATGTMKHFCGNNQEFQRHFADSVISERALREIYLKGFEMAVRSGVANSVMTTYGPVNGIWTAGNYDLNTTILREQWGYDGIVMTDWWAFINERGKEPDKVNFGAMVRAQNDLYMVCPDGSTNASGDNLMEALLDGRLTRAELQRSAMTICQFALDTPAMERFMGNEIKVTVKNRPEEDEDLDVSEVTFIELNGDLVIPLDTKPSKAGTNYTIALDVKSQGIYDITLVGSSKLGELAQMPCTLFFTSIPILTFTFHGTNGREDEIVRRHELRTRFAVMRLYVARNGLDLKEIRFHRLTENHIIQEGERME